MVTFYAPSWTGVQSPWQISVCKWFVQSHWLVQPVHLAACASKIGGHVDEVIPVAMRGDAVPCKFVCCCECALVVNNLQSAVHYLVCECVLCCEQLTVCHTHLIYISCRYSFRFSRHIMSYVAERLADFMRILTSWIQQLVYNFNLHLLFWYDRFKSDVKPNNTFH